MTSEKARAEQENESNKQIQGEEESADLNLGQILKDSGDCGRFQFGIVILISFLVIVLAWSMLGMAFAAAVPDWQCVVFASGDDNNATENATEANVCSINGTACDQYIFDPGMRTIVSEWDLICDKKWVSQTITTIQMTGLLVGGLSWGHVSDGIGRKPTLFISIALLGVLNLVSYFSTGWKMFAVLRFFIGFACTAFMAANVSFEYIRNKWRVYLYLLPNWALWASAMAGACYLLHDWRYLHVIIAAVAFPALLLWFIIPESFRWLVSHGKVDEAEKAVRLVARVNGVPPASLSRLRPAIQQEQARAKENKALAVYTLLDLFRSPPLRKIVALFSIIWMFSAFSYYGIAFGVQELSGNLYLNMFFVNIVDIPGNYLLVLVNTWGGRRYTNMGFYLLGGLFALTVGILQYTKWVSGVSVNVLAFTSKLCISAAWEINTLWSAESLPTVVRNIGSGVLSSVSRVGSIIAPQIINLSTDTPGLLYLGSGVVCLLSCALSFLLEETKHKDLSDMLPPRHVKGRGQGNKHEIFVTKEASMNSV